MRGVWVLLLIFSVLATLMMFAFADSPEAGKAAQKMIAPAFIFALSVFALSGWLLMHGVWWSILCSYAIVLTPPVAVFMGYRVLGK